MWANHCDLLENKLTRHKGLSKFVESLTSIPSNSRGFASLFLFRFFPLLRFTPVPVRPPAASVLHVTQVAVVVIIHVAQAVAVENQSPQTHVRTPAASVTHVSQAVDAAAIARAHMGPRRAEALIRRVNFKTIVSQTGNITQRNPLHCKAFGFS